MPSFPFKVSFKPFSSILSLHSKSIISPSNRLSSFSSQFSTATTTMAPINVTHYKYLVIGGGSGGVASARRAAKFGAKTLLIEGKALGGTCVNVGCVPKKVMWSAATMAKSITEARNYGFDGVDASLVDTFNWPAFKAKRDAYVKRLNGIYARNLEKEGVDFIFGWAKFLNQHTVEVKLNEPDEEGNTTKQYTADHILIATGGAATIPDNVSGAEHGITSDGFFELEQKPEAVAVVGAGYIGVELAGVFSSLNVKTHLFIRHDKLLRKFDPMIQDTLTEIYEKHLELHKNSCILNVEKLDNGKLKLTFRDGSEQNTTTVDALIWTIGRHTLKDDLNLEAVGVKVDPKTGVVITDEYQNTSTPNIYSVGDVSGPIDLTPVAIAAGRKLAMRLFAGEEYKDLKQSYENVPSAVFAHPEIGAIGLTEPEAREKFGDENVKVYKSKFTAMYYAPLDDEQKYPTAYKLVVTGPEEKVVGLHLIGDASSEILQGFGVAVKMGATKKDFDSVVAIHPTSAEEIVTLV